MKLAKLECFPCNFKQLNRVASFVLYTPFLRISVGKGGPPSRGFGRRREHGQLFKGKRHSYFQGTMAIYFQGTKGTFRQKYFGNMTNYFQGTWTPWEGLMYPRIPRLSKNFSSGVVGAQDPWVSQDGAHGVFN